MDADGPSTPAVGLGVSGRDEGGEGGGEVGARGGERQLEVSECSLSLSSTPLAPPAPLAAAGSLSGIGTRSAGDGDGDGPVAAVRTVPLAAGEGDVAEDVGMTTRDVCAWACGCTWGYAGQ